MITKHTFNRSGVSRIALLTIAGTLALSGSTLAQNTTIAEGTSQTTSVVAADDDSVIINNGTITTTGTAGFGINASGADADITNSGSGTITTTGLGANGIFVSVMGADADITNSGIITTTGSQASAIFSSGTGTTYTNSGIITTTGSMAHGINAGAIGTIITSSGSIMTTGGGAHGINAGASGSMIRISGIVSATGDDALAVNGGAETQTLTITKDAQITGAIDLDEGDDVVTLSFGAQITGAIDLGEGDDTVNISPGTAGVSRTYTFKNAETFNIDDSLVFVTRTTTGVTDVVARLDRLDPTTASATRMALGATTGMIHRQLSQRLAFASTAPQVAKGPTASDTHPGWATVFGGHSGRDEDGMALAFKHRYYGVVGGYDTQMESGQRVGLFAGFGRGKVKTSEVASITDTATHGFVGVYGQHVIGDLALDGALVFGRARHKSNRTVIAETANGSYNSTTISPSLTLSWSRALPNGFELRPSAQIAYTYGSYSGYTETGTTNANMTFGKRKVNIVDSRLQLALAQPFAENRGEIEWRAGITATHYGNDSATARLGSGAFQSYDVPGDRTPIGGFVGATLHYAIGDRIRLDSSVEYGQTSASVGALSGQLGLAVNF